MLETIEKLLLLQDRDRRIHRVQQELAHIGPERETFRTKATATQAQLETARTRIKQIESDRKRLELDVGVKKQQIEKYANQQLQTRKNEEYRALAHEIETCKADITKIEDQEIVLMEQAEQVQKEAGRLSREADEMKKLAEGQIAQLDQREENLKKELAELQQGRAELAAAVDESVLPSLRTAVQEQGRKRRRGRASRRLRRLPHEIARANSGHLPGAEGNRGLLELRTDFVLHPRHGAGRGGVTHSRLIDSFAVLVQGSRFAISEGENIPAGHGTVQVVVYQAGHHVCIQKRPLHAGTRQFVIINPIREAGARRNCSLKHLPIPIGSCHN